MKRVLNCRLPLIVNSPAKVFDLNYFKAIYDAGGLPLLDTEYFNDEENIKILNQLSKTKVLFGVRVSALNTKLINVFNEQNIINLDAIIFSYNKADELDKIEFRNKFYKTFAEVKDIDIIEKLERLQLNGIILKGYEAKGNVSKYASFILMQWYLEKTNYAVFIYGGVGMHTTAGIFAAGCSGIILDDQLYLTDEAPVAAEYKSLIAKLDEKDMIVLGEYIDNRYRVFSKLGTKITKELREKESIAYVEQSTNFDLSAEIKKNLIAIDKPSETAIQNLFFLGQDAMFAKYFIKESSKLKDVISNLFKTTGENLEYIEEHDPLVKDSRLTHDHVTTYPIIQGPMGNISDNADFAVEIYKNGALPFFAMGNLPKHIAENILQEATDKLEGFGVGLIGVEAYNKPVVFHLELIKAFKKVKYAIIAGGIPAQANDLEVSGIKTYLHTPALQMLENAINNCTAHRFIFEGNEAGGHVGSLTSMSLWELAIERLSLQDNVSLRKQSIIFAGGISSKSGSAFISGIASKLSSRGAKIGISVATSYLFSKEIVETKAIKQLYQDILKEKNDTVVVANTIGLPTRTTLTPYSENVLTNEHKWIKDRTDLQERKAKFETFNLGSLLIAAKAFSPNYERKNDNEPEFLYFDEKEHYKKGNFITGDAVAFYDKALRISEIHNTLFDSKNYLYSNLNELEILTHENCEINDEIAVIGIAGKYPDAANVEEFWQNIVSKKYSIIEVPKEKLDLELYYDKDRKAEDKTYSHIAGVLKESDFDHEKFGYTKEEAGFIGRSQKVILETAFNALEDAGYLNGKQLPKKRTGVIIGDCLDAEFIDRHHKYFYPEIKYYLEQIEDYNKLNNEQKKEILDNIKKLLSKKHLNDKFENTLLNINAARISKHLGLEGSSYAVDAACATSFIAFDCSVKSLLSHEYDCMITGGVSINLSPELFVGFCKMGGLSDDGSFPLDERANGFVIGEGAGVLVLKRMKDAIRDNDKIHAIIKAVGTSSDGKGKAIAAPNPDGQGYALKRCHAKIKSEFTIDDIDYIEAHGTSTLAGDAAEIQTIKNIYKVSHPIGISSVKSQIGHLLSGAGVAGITKAIMAIKNKTLPPNGQFKTLSDNIKLTTPLYVIADPTEWKKEDGKSRMAAISSFGFGGINTHVVVEEYTKNYSKIKRNIFSNPEFDFNDNRVVIVGTGCLLPDAFDTETYWINLQSGKKSFYDIPENRMHNEFYSKIEEKEFNIPKIKAGVIKDFKFNSMKYKMPPATIKLIDKHQLYAVEAASQAIEQSGLKPILINGNKVGVVMGNTMSGENFYEIINRVRVPAVNKCIDISKGIDAKSKKSIIDKITILERERFPKSTEDTFPGYIANLVSGRIANIFNCNGPNFIVDAASTSSANAISLAIKGIKNNDYEYAITGGSDINLTPSVIKGLQQWGMLSADTNSVFDKNSDGVNPAEGAVVFVMTKYSTAIKNNMKILAELNDISFASPATDTKLSTPDKSSYQNAIDNYYSRSQITNSQVNFIEVYGSGNVLFDMMEEQVISNRFTNNLSFGSIKSNFGYLKSAHPAAVLLKLVLMNQNRKIVPFNLNLNNSIVNDKSILKPNKEAITINEDENRYYGANIFGIGGNHGHMVVSNIPLYLTGAETKSEINYDQEKKLIKEEKTEAAIIRNQEAGRKIAALLSGQGSQYIGMMKELYDTEEIFRLVLEKGEHIFRSIKGYSLLELMFLENEKLISTENTQPAIFIATAAIFDYLKAKGFEPDHYIGHSLGEFSALYCAGMLEFEDALKLVIKRATLMQEVANQKPGSMVAVFKDEFITEKLVKDSNISIIYVANKNCEEQTVVSGENSGISNFMAYLKTQNITHAKVNVATAFHTPFFNNASGKLRDYLEDVKFNNTDFTKVFSNVTGEKYPQDERTIKDLLAKQMVSPVEFVKTIKNASIAGTKIFVEEGPNKILSNLIKKIKVETEINLYSVDPKVGEIKSLEKLISELNKLDLLKPVILKKKEEINLNNQNPIIIEADSKVESLINFNSNFSENSAEFSKYINEEKDEISKLLYANFLKYKKEKAIEQHNNFGLFSGNIVISGVSIGLPGSGYRVFDGENFEKILSGMNFIEALSEEEKGRIFDKNITRLNKESDGNAKFQELKNTDEVIQLAAKLGYFDLKKDYGIDFNYDITYSLAIAAGIEALKDANIPLVMQYKKTSSGSFLPEGYALPKEMQEKTGVIFSSVFHGYESIIDEVTKFYKDKFINKPLNEFENIYFYLMENVKDLDIKRSVTDWFSNIKHESKVNEPYHFNRKLLLDIAALGSTHFAQIIKAKGPNTQISATCSSTTQAIGIAEDWIRTGRCDRVIIIGGEAATSEKQQEWIGASFLAIGAATEKRTINEAVLPFDERRNGLVLGSAAVSVIIEKEEEIKKRGLNGEALILGTYIGNSAFHASKIDSEYFATEMKKFFDRTERIYNLKKDIYTKSLLFMSHESYTPGQGGPASAEVYSLKKVFPDHYKDITITNIKGFTGSTLGAAAEDAVMVKALQKNKAPVIANLKQIPEEFRELKFSDGKDAIYNYGVHLAAGFGSYFSFLFIKKLAENRIENNEAFIQWLKSISNQENPKLVIINNTLCIKSDKQSQTSYTEKSIEIKKETETKPVSAPIVKTDVRITEEIKLEQKEKITQQNAPIINKSEPTPEYVKESSDVLNVIKSIIAEQTGYTVDLLDENLDLEADLGIDTVKQVEIFGKITSKFNLSVPENIKLNKFNTISKIQDFVHQGSNPLPIKIDEEVITQTETAVKLKTKESAINFLGEIKAIVAEQTGYTVDLLDENLDLEADLGIDTVKQVEIFGKITATFNLNVPENLKLNKYNTIKKIEEFVKQESGSVQTEAAQVQSEVKTEIKEIQAIQEPANNNILNEIKNIVSEQTGYTVDLLDENLDLEADLGIDTVKQVEIFGKITATFNLNVPENLKLNKYNTIKKIEEFVKQESVSTSLVIQEEKKEKINSEAEVNVIRTISNVLPDIKNIISEQTGYTTDLLDENMDLEADLGIDTVKQVEIFGKITSKFNLSVPENLKLNKYNTILKIAEFVNSSTTIAEPVIEKKEIIINSEENHESKSAPVTFSDETSFKGVNIADEIKIIISDQTGYEKDMLESNLDLEADLGIDTVKQVEIFGKITTRFNLNVPESFKLSKYNTISKIVEFVGSEIFLPKIENIELTKEAKPVTVKELEREKTDTEILSETKIPMNGNVVKEVRNIISAITGTELEKLGDELDLESELGIDSMKMVEICQRVSQKFKFTLPENFQISELTTISKITAFIKRRVSDIESMRKTSSRSVKELNADKKLSKVNDNSIKRLVLTAITDEKSGNKTNVFSGKTILITLDKHGFAEELVNQIHALDGNTIILGDEENENHISLSSPEELEKQIQYISNTFKHIDGFIHLAPINYYFTSKLNKEAINLSIKSFFIIIKHLFEQLNKKGSIVSSLSFNSVVFPYTDSSYKIHPIFGGISGLLKTVHKELPESIVKIVDFKEENPIDNIKSIIDTYVKELMSDDTRAEIGYDMDRKVILKAQESDYPFNGESFITNGSTILISGGARGITFEIAKELIKKYSINLVIVGKTNILSIDKKYLNENFDEKAAFNELKDKMKGAKPIEIKNALENIVRIREINNNINYLKSLGTDIYYEAADVSNLTALNILANNYSDIDGIIHAAGIEESNFIPKKELSSFNRVFDSKVYGALNLIDAFEKNAYKFFITFSSVAAKFGNEGQIDYSAANDMLCKIILQQKQKHPEKFYKIISWTAWKGTGMANKETILKVLQEKGVEFIEINQGVKFFMDEIKDSSECEVIITEANKSIDKDGILNIEPFIHEEIKVTNDFCFIEKILKKNDTSCEATYTFSLNKDYYLASHNYSGTAVVPGTFITEIMIQNSRILAPFMNFIKVSDLKLHYVIKLLKNQDKQIKIFSEIINNESDEITIHAKIVSDILNFKGEIAEKDKLHSECNITFSKNKPAVSLGEYDGLDFSSYNNIEKSNTEMFYDESLLFMGPKMQTVSKLLFLSNKQAIAELKYNDAEIIKDTHNQCFTADPILFDGCLQLGVLILGIYHKYTGLPAGIRNVYVFDKIEKDKTYYAVSFLKSDGFNNNDKSYLIDIILYDKSWNPVLFIDNFKGFVALEVNKELLVKIENELVFSNSSSVKIENVEQIKQSVQKPRIFPFIDSKHEESTDKQTYNRILDLKRDIFLDHHKRGEVPLFLAATGIETMAEAACSKLNQDKMITEISNLSIPYGIKILKGKAKEIFITAENIYNSEHFKTTIYSVFRNNLGIIMGEPTLHYKANFKFSSDYEKSFKVSLPDSQSLQFEGNLTELLYHPERLFMDGMFETINEILYFDNSSLVTKIHTSNDKRCFSNTVENNFVTDVITIDGMFQTCGVIELLTTNNLVLPYEIERMKIYAETTPDNEYICLTKKIAEHSDRNEYQIQLLDKDNNVLLDIEKMSMIKVTRLSEEFKIYDKIKIPVE